jgi:hypothetical protein
LSSWASVRVSRRPAARRAQDPRRDRHVRVDRGHCREFAPVARRHMQRRRGRPSPSGRAGLWPHARIREGSSTRRRPTPSNRCTIAERCAAEEAPMTRWTADGLIMVAVRDLARAPVGSLVYLGLVPVFWATPEFAGQNLSSTPHPGLWLLMRLATVAWGSVVTGRGLPCHTRHRPASPVRSACVRRGSPLLASYRGARVRNCPSSLAATACPAGARNGGRRRR